MDLLVPETVDGRYKVLDVIGTGAMATVYAAEDIRLGRKVAMKILRPEQAQDKTFRSRFKREAEAVASLNNPGIVAVYDTGAYSPSDPTADTVLMMPLTMTRLRSRTSLWNTLMAGRCAVSFRRAGTFPCVMRWGTQSSF